MMTGDEILDAGGAGHGAAPRKMDHSLAVGGEKALTKRAAIHSIFQLNPRPALCLLDEVDA
jgi:hypothetical protein